MLDRIKESHLIAGEIWSRLEAACTARQHPFNLATIATADKQSVSQRIVVLRAVDRIQSQLIFFTDIRSAKVQALHAGSEISWLFYDPVEKIQLRIQTTPVIHHQDEMTQRFWKTVPQSNRINYATVLSPGTAISDYPEQYDSNPDQAEANFAVICGNIRSIEILQIHPSMHFRAMLKKAENGWKLDWLIP